MKKNTIIIAALLLAAVSLQAATITQTNTFSGSPNYSSVLTFNKFNDYGGAFTLNSIFINVVLNTEAGAYLGIDNDGQTAASGSVEFGSSGSLSSDYVSLRKVGTGSFSGTLKSISLKTMNLSADDSDGATYSTQGTDYDALITSSTSVSTNASLRDIEDYIGTDTYTLTYTVSQWMSMGAFSGAQFQGNPIGANGSVVVEYNYTIPEPASASMAALVVIAGFWIRRRFID